VPQHVSNGSTASGSGIHAARITPLRWEHRPRALPAVQVEEVLLAARHLPQTERALLDSVYRRGMSIHAIAVATGLPPQRLRRRLRSIVRRLRAPMFRYVLRELFFDHSDSSGDEAAVALAQKVPRARRRRSNRVSRAQSRAIARGIVLERRSQRSVARELDLSVHQLRCELQRLRALACEKDS
jgi:hypothetical protein